MTQSISDYTQKIESECKKKNAKLCVVAKTQPIDSLRLANISPQIIFAENKVQEAEKKQEFYANIHNEVHFIGTLQKNKVRKAIQLFDTIQTVDSLELLRRIDNISGEEEKMVKVFLNVNISEDPNKSGMSLDEIVNLVQNLKKNPHKNIVIAGVFTILKQGLSNDNIAGFYGIMTKLFKSLKEHFGPQFTEISMGMSNDYKIALEQGATMVRVGRGIFGERNNDITLPLQ